MNMLILKLGDMLSFELQQRQLSKSGTLTVLCYMYACVCTVCLHSHVHERHALCVGVCVGMMYHCMHILQIYIRVCTCMDFTLSLQLSLWHIYSRIYALMQIWHMHIKSVCAVYVCRGDVSFRAMPPPMHIDLFAYLYLSGALSACAWQF